MVRRASSSPWRDARLANMGQEDAYRIGSLSFAEVSLLGYEPFSLEGQSDGWRTLLLLGGGNLWSVALHWWALRDFGGVYFLIILNTHT